MSLFDQLGSKANLPDRNQMANLVQQLQSNPVGFLSQMGYNVPNNIDIRNPNNLLSYLLQSNQVNNGLLAQAQKLVGLFH